MTAAAVTETAYLDDFEGQAVVASGIEIPNAAGGLRDAMMIDPQTFHHEEKVYVVLECSVAKIRFDPIKDSDELTRVHVFSAKAAAIVDGGLVQAHLDEQKERVQLAKEEAAGIKRLQFEDTDPEKWAAEQAAAAAEGAPAPIKDRASDA